MELNVIQTWIHFQQWMVQVKCQFQISDSAYAPTSYDCPLWNECYVQAGPHVVIVDSSIINAKGHRISNGRGVCSNTVSGHQLLSVEIANSLYCQDGCAMEYSDNCIISSAATSACNAQCCSSGLFCSVSHILVLCYFGSLAWSIGAVTHLYGNLLSAIFAAISYAARLTVYCYSYISDLEWKQSILGISVVALKGDVNHYYRNVLLWASIGTRSSDALHGACGIYITSLVR